MHFWISKQSQHGNRRGRMPTSLFSVGGPTSQNQYLEQNHFQSSECEDGSALHPLGISHPPHTQQYIANTSNYDNTMVNNGPPRPFTRGIIEVDGTVNSTPLELMPAYLKFGICASLVIIISYFAVINILENKTSNIMGAILATIIALILLGVCGAYICRAKPVPSVAILTVPPVILSTPSQLDSNEDVAPGIIFPIPTDPPSPAPPPPSYLTAMLLPQHNSVNTEAPPPSYEKAIG